MPSADDGVGRIGKEETLLYEDGPWKLVKHDISLEDIVQSQLHSYIAHYCQDMNIDYYWYSLALIDDKCYGCGLRPPSDIMGLWKLHNMDYIQEGVSF